MLNRQSAKAAAPHAKKAARGKLRFPLALARGNARIDATDRRWNRSLLATGEKGAKLPSSFGVLAVEKGGCVE
jgi:hypothetical protein